MHFRASHPKTNGHTRIFMMRCTIEQDGVEYGQLEVDQEYFLADEKIAKIQACHVVIEVRKRHSY